MSTVHSFLLLSKNTLYILVGFKFFTTTKEILWTLVFIWTVLLACHACYNSVEFRFLVSNKHVVTPHCEFTLLWDQLIKHFLPSVYLPLDILFDKISVHIFHILKNWVVFLLLNFSRSLNIQEIDFNQVYVTPSVFPWCVVGFFFHFLNFII